MNQGVFLVLRVGTSTCHINVIITMSILTVIIVLTIPNI